MDTIINTLYSFYLRIKPFVLLGAGWLAKYALDLYKQHDLQKKHIDLQKELEALKLRYQLEIQAHYLQTQFKVTSLYKIYPELLKEFKVTEGLIFQFCKNPERWLEDLHKSCFSLTQKLAGCLLFLDDDLVRKCILAKDKMTIDVWDLSEWSEDDKKDFLDDISEQIKIITAIMRAHLIEKSLNHKLIFIGLVACQL